MVSLGVYLYLALVVVAPVDVGLVLMPLVAKIVPMDSRRCRIEAHCILHSFWTKILWMNFFILFLICCNMLDITYMHKEPKI